MSLSDMFTRFRRDDRGSATVEFVVLFPLYMIIFILTIESGFFMIRHVMLDRSVDLAVREIRLNPGQQQEDDALGTLKSSVCSTLKIQGPDNCENNIRIQMTPVSTVTWQGLGSPAECIDAEADVNVFDQNSYQAGAANELMMLRVCALYTPVLSLSAQLMGLPLQSNGQFAISVSSGFVNEPV